MINWFIQKRRRHRARRELKLKLFNEQERKCGICGKPMTAVLGEKEEIEMKEVPDDIPVLARGSEESEFMLVHYGCKWRLR